MTRKPSTKATASETMKFDGLKFTKMSRVFFHEDALKEQALFHQKGYLARVVCIDRYAYAVYYRVKR